MKLQTLNFAAGSRVRNTKQQMKKFGQKGAWPRSRDLLLHFETPYNLRLRWSYKRQILQPDRWWGMLNKKMKNWAKRAWPRSRDLLMNFAIPYYLRSGWSYKRTFAARSRVGNAKKNLKNWAKYERGLGHVIYYCIMGPPYYLRLGRRYKRQILQADSG